MTRRDGAYDNRRQFLRSAAHWSAVAGILTLISGTSEAEEPFDSLVKKASDFLLALAVRNEA